MNEERDQFLQLRKQLRNFKECMSKISTTAFNDFCINIYCYG